MKITLLRRYHGATYTVGTMSIDGSHFCDTLEDKVRNLAKEAKIAGRTAIPAGIYTVVVNRSPRFGRDLPRLLNVPHFDGILIHRGNTPEDTSGCILLGENKVKGQVVNSTPYEIELTRRIKASTAKGESCIIEIVEP